jgi:hypothetical protein
VGFERGLVGANDWFGFLHVLSHAGQALTAYLNHRACNHFLPTCQVRALGVAEPGHGGIAGFLKKACTPPSDLALDNALDLLLHIGGSGQRAFPVVAGSQTSSLT